MRGKVGLAIALAMGISGTAHAGPFTPERVDNGTKVYILGPAGDKFSVTEPGKPPLTGTTPVVGGALVSGVTIGPLSPGTKGKAVVKNLSEDDVPTQVVSLFAPGYNVVVSDYTIGRGSQITFGTEVFTLAGGFSTVDTWVDYDPTSASYGAESGFVSSLNIMATNGVFGLTFDLPGPANYGLNLAGAWAQSDASQPAIAPLSFNFSGTMNYGGLSTPFVGNFDGSDTFRMDGTTLAQGSLTFDTHLGRFAGALNATALPRISAVPEPSAWTLAIVGFCLAGAALRSRRSTTALHPAHRRVRA